MNSPHALAELQYDDYPDLAGLLRTYLLNGSTRSWQTGLAEYTKTAQSADRIIADLDALLGNHFATNEPVLLWVKAHTTSADGCLTEGVPVRVSLLELSDALVQDLLTQRIAT
jgi:hypothetical protein